MDRETVRQIVTEEITRPEIVEVLAEATESPLDKLLRFLGQPVILTLLGFLLTALIGNQIEERFSKSSEQRTQVAAAIEGAEADQQRAQDRLLDFIKIGRERVVAGDLLRSAVSRNAGSLVARKGNYDASYVKWNVELRSNLIMLRSVIGEAGVGYLSKSPFEKAVESYIAPRLYSIDNCLTLRFDQIVNGGSAPTQACAAASWYGDYRFKGQQINECLDAIAGAALRQLDHQTDKQIAALQGKKFTQPAPKTQQHISKGCPE